MLGPLPRWLTGCAYPFLPLPHRPSPKSQRVGCSTSFRSTTSERGSISRLQSFVNLQASEFAATQVVPTAETSVSDVQGGCGVYVRAQRGLLPPRASDTLAVRNRAIDGKDLSPSRFAALPAATGTFTSRLSTVRSPSPSLGITTTVTGLLCWRVLHPLEWQLASLHQIRKGCSCVIRLQPPVARLVPTRQTA